MNTFGASQGTSAGGSWAIFRSMSPWSRRVKAKFGPTHSFGSLDPPDGPSGRRVTEFLRCLARLAATEPRRPRLSRTGMRRGFPGSGAGRPERGRPAPDDHARRRRFSRIDCVSMESYWGARRSVTGVAKTRRNRSHRAQVGCSRLQWGIDSFENKRRSPGGASSVRARRTLCTLLRNRHGQKIPRRADYRDLDVLRPPNPSGDRRYAHTHQSWSIFLEQRDLSGEPPRGSKSWDGDGIISRTTTKSMVEAARASKIPLIDLTDRHETFAVHQVWSDDGAIARLGAEHLLERGFQNFAFCGFSRELVRPASRPVRRGGRSEGLGV